MQYKFAFVAIGTLLFVAPSLAQQNPQSNTVASKPAAKEKTYCFQFSLDTGSRINRMECKTRKQWELLGVDVDNPNGK
jgi:hypothetical protein